MPCFRPLRAHQATDGRVFFVESQRNQAIRNLELACGQCIGCRLERSRRWAVRCVHEATLHEWNCFVTFTYQTAPPSLVYDDFQRFMKRLRKKVNCFDVTLGHWVPRYFVGGEYGEEKGRPHFHACLFGYRPNDLVLHSQSGSGAKLYRSAFLEKTWGLGFVTVGDMTFESAAYVARYCVAKVTGQSALVAAHYGEREPEFGHMSLRPGIGAIWLEKFSKDVFPAGRLITRGGIEVRTPAYYDKWFKRQDFDSWEQMKLQRQEEARSRFEDNTDARLHVKEQVQLARVGFLKRNLR